MNNPELYPPLIHEPVWGEINGRSEALGFITRTLQAYDLTATFFVEAVHTRHFGVDPMKRYTDHLLASHQDVQLHIHPVWLNFDKSKRADVRYNDDCSALPESFLTELIVSGCAQIEQWTGNRPVALRTGNFSAAPVVYKAMRSAGLVLGSNVCIACESYPVPSLNRSGGAHLIEGIWELPAASFMDKPLHMRRRYRAAQITACTAGELREILDQCYSQSASVVVIVTHPFEFIKKSNYRYASLRPNRMVQGRLEKLCKYLKDNEDRFDVTSFADLAEKKSIKEQPEPLLESTVTKSLFRAGQNFINDRI